MQKNIKSEFYKKILLYIESNLGSGFTKGVRELFDLLFGDGGANLSGVQNAADVASDFKVSHELHRCKSI